jgi:type IV secretion system protein VirD4
MLGWLFRRTGKRQGAAQAAPPEMEKPAPSGPDPMAGFPRGLPDGDQDKPGASARWPSLDEMAELRSGPQNRKMCEWRPGMFLLGKDAEGRIYGHDDDRHVLTVAGSRAGKGVSLIVPNLLFWPGSCIVIDPKGELATLTASRRSAEGSGWSSPITPGVGEVYALDPFGRVTGKAKDYAFAGFNPMADIDVTKPGGFDRCSLLADALVVQSSGEGAHWTQGARMVILMMIYFVAATKRPEEKNLITVRRLLTLRGNDLFDLFDEMVGCGNPACVALGKLWRGTREGELQSVMASASTQTAFLDGEEMERVLSHSSFRLEDLKEKRITVYLCLPALRLATHSKWFRMIVNMAMDAMERTGPIKEGQHRVLFCLDEFAAIGANETIEKAAGQIASFGVKLWPIIQDLPQMVRDYPASWETFMGNAGLLTFFGNTDLTTTKHVSARLGETEILRWTRTESKTSQESEGGNTPNLIAALFGLGNSGGGTTRGISKGDNRGRSQQVQRVPLMQASEVVGCFARERGNILVLIPDKPPLALNRMVHYSAEDDGLFGGLFEPIEGQKNPLTRRDQREAREEAGR